MASAFGALVGSVLAELSPRGDFRPVRSLAGCGDFAPCRLLVRSRWRWLWEEYKGAHLSIADVLEPAGPEPAVERVCHYHFRDATDGQLQASVELAAPGQGRVAGEATVSGSSSAATRVCLLRVPPGAWEALRKERRPRRPEPGVLQQLRRQQRNLYVVTQALQAQEDVEVTRSQGRAGSGRVSLPLALGLQGQGQGCLDRKRTVTIPAGSVFAFQPALLTLGDDWDVVSFPHKGQRTFPARKSGSPVARISGTDLGRSSALESDDGAQVSEDWQGLRAEVEAQAEDLSIMSTDLSQQLLDSLGQVLADSRALQDLDELLEQGLCGRLLEPQEGLVGAILECLMLSSGQLEQELSAGVLYLLDALAVLTETQRGLLASHLRALSGPLRLVGSVLQQSSPWQQRQPVALPAELRDGHWGPAAPAWALLAECGLEPRAAAPHLGWEPGAGARVCALYACLALLSRLSQAQ